MPRRFDHLKDNRIDHLTIDYLRFEADSPDSLIVFLNSGMTRDRKPGSISFMRRTWADEMPNRDVLCFADPALTPHDEITGGFYMDTEVDILENIAGIVEEFASERGISPDKIIFYGSSYGATTAIALASLVKGAYAIAECPQIDYAEWLPDMIDPLQEVIIGPIEEHRKKFPEQVSLKGRLRKSNWIPAFTLVTNLTEYRLTEQIEFFKWAQTTRIPKSNDRNIVCTTLVAGHAALPFSRAVKLLPF